MSPPKGMGAPGGGGEPGRGAATVDDDSARAARGAGRAIARLARHLDHGLAPVDLTIPQYRVMALLAEGTAASTSLADRLTVSPPSVTAVVDGLVARGFVVRNPDPHDRRRLNLELTDEGRALLVAADASVNERLVAIAAHLDGIDPDDAVSGLENWHEGLDGFRAERRQENASRGER